MPRTSPRCSHLRPVVGLLLAATMLLGVGCGAEKSYINFKGLSPLNEDESNISRQVRVHVYQLKGKEKFEACTYEDLYTDEKAQKKLEDERIGPPKVYTIDPGRETDEPRVIDLDVLSPDCKYVGVVGLFEGGAEKSGERRLAILKEDLPKHIFAFQGYQVILINKN